MNWKSSLLFVLVALVYAVNLPIDVMEIDAAQYASIAKEMLETNSYLEVYDQGADYLDKPPLLFWLSAASMKLFGVNNIAYKLPAVLILILGVFSLYRLGRLYYDKHTSSLAALLLAASNAWFLMSNDVRTDGILSGFIVFSVWQLLAYVRFHHWHYLLGSAVGIAFALMAKGPIGLIIILAAVGGHWLILREWKSIFKWQWILVLLLVGVLLSPMLYGLYVQFDLHPEKEVYGLKGPSGILFFFYTQSFGRITGDIYWSNNAPWNYFFDTMAWDMQPWFILFLLAFGFRLWHVYVHRKWFEPKEEFFTLTGFIFPLVALSMSKFKLPHYVFPLFPFAALITAHFMIHVLPENKVFFKWVRGFQTIVSVLLFAAVGIAFIFFFEPNSWQVFNFILLVAAFFYIRYTYKKINISWYVPHVFAFIAFGFMLGIYFYPNLLKYQFSSQMASYLNSTLKEGKKVLRFGVYDRSLGFYTQQRIPLSDSAGVANCATGTLVVCTQESWKELQEKQIRDFDTVAIYKTYQVTLLTPEFLLASTRESVLKQAFLLQKH
jgi:4-amino-4-deoxy-L-arabinose transferase-like glycosyltransferase